MENMENIFNRMQEISNLEDEVNKKKGELSEALEEIRDNNGKSFVYEGKTFQIRKRGDRLYLAKMEKKPGRKKREQPTDQG